MSFKKFCTNQGYQINTAEMNLDFESAGVEQRHHTIRTDNGGKLAGSDDFRTKVSTYWRRLHLTHPARMDLPNGHIEHSKKKYAAYSTPQD
jgi:hypothetical protein